MSEKNCTTCRFGYQAEEYYSHGRMKWCCMLETGGERQRYALGKARYDPRSCIKWEGEEARLVATNYEKYFGTPDLAALSTIEPYADALTGAQMIRVTHGGREAVVIKARYFGVWLKMEAEDDDQLR